MGSPWRLTRDPHRQGALGWLAGTGVTGVGEWRPGVGQAAGAGIADQ